MYILYIINTILSTTVKYYIYLSPLHQRCRPAISPSDALSYFCPQSFPASGTFPMSQLLASDNQNTSAMDTNLGKLGEVARAR